MKSEIFKQGSKDGGESHQFGFGIKERDREPHWPYRWTQLITYSILELISREGENGTLAVLIAEVGQTLNIVTALSHTSHWINT